VLASGTSELCLRRLEVPQETSPRPSNRLRRHVLFAINSSEPPPSSCRHHRSKPCPFSSVQVSTSTFIKSAPLSSSPNEMSGPTRIRALGSFPSSKLESQCPAIQSSLVSVSGYCNLTLVNEALHSIGPSVIMRHGRSGKDDVSACAWALSTSGQDQISSWRPADARARSMMDE
jgi:hypothetical protein